MYESYEDAVEEITRMLKDPGLMRQLSCSINPGGSDKAIQKAERILVDLKHHLVWRKRNFLDPLVTPKTS
jgi:hypothetical protein